MRTLIVTIIFFTMNCAMFIEPVYSKSPLLDSVKVVVANYFNKIYGNENLLFIPEDINRKFQIIDIITRQSVDKEVKNGMIYHCALYGDDVFGFFVFLENNRLNLLEINNTLQVERARLFMRRHDYTLEQMDRCFDYITTVYIEEHSSMDYKEFIESTDYIQYIKELQQTLNITDKNNEN